MKLLLKISLSLIILLIIAAIGFAAIFDPNDYKKELITLVKDKTGRDLSMPGDISLSFFPWIGIDLGAIKISNAKGFGKQPFAQMSHLQVRVKFLPLFKQQLEADTIVIDGLELNLAKNKQGLSNWDDFTKTTTKTPIKTDKQKDSRQNILAAIALNGIKIQNAQFNWHDQQQKQKISIKDVQLSIGELRPATKVPFNLQFHLQEKTLDAQIKFKSEIIFSSDLKQFSFYDTQLASELKLATLKQHLSPQFNSALMQLDLDKQTFNTKELNLSENSLKLQTRISAEKLLSSPYINSHITLHTFNLRNIAENFEIKLPDMADKKTLTQLSAQLDIKGSLKKIELTNIELSLDDTNIVGNAKLKPMPGSSAVNLVVDNINLDRYLPKPTTDKKTENKKANKKTKEAILIPVALLSAFNADASVKIKKLQIKKTHWENLSLVAHAKNGKTHIKPLTIQGYAATIKSDFIIKAVKNNALLSGNLNIKNIKAGKLLNDLTGKDKLKGQTTIVASFNTSGLKLSQLKQNLNGKLKLNLKDGTLKGFDLNHQLNVLNAKIKGKATPVAPKPAETKIAKLSASAVIKKGILNNKDLRASTPLSRIAGRGTVDIAKEKINYTASVKFTSSTSIKASTSFEEMKAIPLDIHIGGSFDEPRIKVDFQKVLEQLVKKEIKKHESEIKEKAKEDLQKKLDDKLKKLFKF